MARKFFVRWGIRHVTGYCRSIRRIASFRRGSFWKFEAFRACLFHRRTEPGHQCNRLRTVFCGNFEIREILRDSLVGGFENGETIFGRAQNNTAFILGVSHPLYHPDPGHLLGQGDTVFGSTPRRAESSESDIFPFSTRALSMTYFA